jgi:hypothetical protein
VGGELVPAKVILESDHAVRLNRAGILADTSTPILSGRVVLLTDDDLLILPDRFQNTLILRRGGLTGILMSPSTDNKYS